MYPSARRIRTSGTRCHLQTSRAQASSLPTERLRITQEISGSCNKPTGIAEFWEDHESGPPFAFYIQVNIANKSVPKRKSSPAFLRLRDSKGQSPLVALARAKLRKQQSKIRPHKEKKKQTVTTQNAQSRKSKKPHAEKETVDPLFYTAKERSVDHLPCMRH